MAFVVAQHRTVLGDHYVLALVRAQVLALDPILRGFLGLELVLVIYTVAPVFAETGAQFLVRRGALPVSLSLQLGDVPTGLHGGPAVDEPRLLGVVTGIV